MHFSKEIVLVGIEVIILKVTVEDSAKATVKGTRNLQERSVLKGPLTLKFILNSIHSTQLLHFVCTNFRAEYFIENVYINNDDGKF